MGVPFEALIPYGIIITVGAVLPVIPTSSVHSRRCLASPEPVSLPRNTSRMSTRRLGGTEMLGTGKVLQERDFRITGSLRAQSGVAEAPKGFEVSNPWKLEKRIF
ncbi:hypothetical protein C8Q69DRAFT_509340 [Paecilomyces variotii]|uniref:NADH dehydrogenase [ubiquinone] 1 alpha subcomplex subunit 1 n=1 Tax=Byssochlamys spectabilis TaxID=264951 RepID=A0A443HNL0_BYSSP|nr:hypothetical protein C8Q69DRAFT_509340 [Paecilomyces variotii]RWQ93395.1 hypothetical protein C8Q69DRAFT_509340 [Paecilomyces variotii]